jgi:hypothetical protein
LGSTARTFINVGDTPEALRRIIADLAGVSHDNGMVRV